MHHRDRNLPFASKPKRKNGSPDSSAPQAPTHGSHSTRNPHLVRASIRAPSWRPASSSPARPVDRAAMRYDRGVWFSAYCTYVHSLKPRPSRPSHPIPSHPLTFQHALRCAILRVRSATLGPGMQHCGRHDIGKAFRCDACLRTRSGARSIMPSIPSRRKLPFFPASPGNADRRVVHLGAHAFLIEKTHTSPRKPATSLRGAWRLAEEPVQPSGRLAGAGAGVRSCRWSCL